MRASLISPNLQSPTPLETSFNESRKASAPTDSSDRSFDHALTRARKSAKQNDVKAKTEKASKAKPSKESGVAVDVRKKADKTGAKDSDDADSGDSGADSPQDDATPHDDQAATPTAQNPAGEDADARDESGATSDEAEITAAAHEAAQATSRSPATARPATTALQPVTNTAKGQSQTAAANSKDPSDDARNSAASAVVIQPQAASRPLKLKAPNPADAGDSTALAGNAKNAGVSTPDALTTAPGLPTTVVQSAPKNSQEQAATTVAVEADSSSDPDAADSELAAPSAVVPSTAPDQPDSTSLGDPSHSTQVAGMIDQSSVATFAQTVAGESPASSVNGTSARAVAPASNPGAKFVAENHPNIVQSVKTQLLPTGGTMRLRLDPPELGAMQVSVHVKDGVVTASFETSNDQATKMLSHSLGQLKQALESQGITVGKMHVQQSATGESAGNQTADRDSDSDPSSENTSSSQQDEQRRETLRRMWERLSIGGDPLDLVA